MRGALQSSSSILSSKLSILPFRFNSEDIQVFIKAPDQVFAEYMAHTIAASIGRLIHHLFTTRLVVERGVRKEYLQASPSFTINLDGCYFLRDKRCRAMHRQQERNQTRERVAECSGRSQRPEFWRRGGSTRPDTRNLFGQSELRQRGECYRFA